MSKCYEKMMQISHKCVFQMFDIFTPQEKAKESYTEIPTLSECCSKGKSVLPGMQREQWLCAVSKCADWHRATYESCMEDPPKTKNQDYHMILLHHGTPVFPATRNSSQVMGSA